MDQNDMRLKRKRDEVHTVSHASVEVAKETHDSLVDTAPLSPARLTKIGGDKKQRVDNDSTKQENLSRPSTSKENLDRHIRGTSIAEVAKHLTKEQDITETMNGKESDQKKKKKKKTKKKKQHKSYNGDGDSILINNEINGEGGRQTKQSDGNKIEKDENRRKEKKKKKDRHDVQDLEGHAILEEGGKKNKKRKVKPVKVGSHGKKQASRTKKHVERNDPSKGSHDKETSKKVSFSDHVEVFPSSVLKSAKDVGYLRGKRFTKEEDEMVKKAVMNYIETHGLGEEGLNMVLHCRSHQQVKHCWKEIGEALPWRPSESVYHRAHIIFQRSEDRKWTPEELEMVRKFHKKHGANWKMLADALGKHRHHVKDAWRRIRLPNQKKGHWLQEEYQTLFDLVNMDLRLKALAEKKSKHGMLRDNISWEAVSDTLASRSSALCCMKWYDQLTSPMVADGLWADTDDFHLVNALSSLDACCVDDVDWDNLVEHRSGAISQKRWKQMVKHLGADGNKPFPEQVEILSARYSPDVLEAREIYNSKTPVDC